MTALASSDVVFARVDGTRVIGARNKRRVMGTITFGDGSKTYPANGVPLPVPASGVGGMGLARHLDRLEIVDQVVGGDAMIYKFDSTHNSIRIFFPTQQTAGTGNRAGAEVTTSYTPANATALTVLVEGI